MWRAQIAVTAVSLLVVTILVSRMGGRFFPLYQVQSQDIGTLLLLSISLLIAAFWMPRWRLPTPGALWLSFAGLVIVGLLGFGSYTLMDAFPLSVDERMVVFDMAVFDRMRLATPLSPDWRPYVQALFPAFLLGGKMSPGLVSSYLPMNALLRLAFSKLADPVLFNPLLAFAGGAALFDIARRTFGRDDPACWVSLLVYGLSAQMLINAMTVYSMTAHMALNLIWLAAFLRGGKAGLLIAIATGFVATGLHQLAYHPFFVAPFLLWRLRRGEWKLVLVYAVAYSAIVLWWAVYPILEVREIAGATRQPIDVSLATRVSEILVDRPGGTAITMFLNLLHFIAWQNFALLALLPAAMVVAIRDRGLAGALLLGIVLWLTFIALVIPFQGHGWGYRYLHPYFGSFALLGGFGYRELRIALGSRIDGVVLGLSGVTAIAAIPMLCAAASGLVRPYVAVDKLMASQATPMVIVDTEFRPTVDGKWAGNPIENVRNLPDMTNRPLRLSGRDLDSEGLLELCRRGAVTVITRADLHRAGFGLNIASDSPEFIALTTGVGRSMPGCLKPARVSFPG